MFSLLKKVVSTVWDWKNEDDGQKDSDIQSPQQKHDTDCELKLSFDGKITKLNNLERYGLIDNTIYFNFNVVCGSENLFVGNPVFGTAVRDNIDCSWSAASVTLCGEQWDHGDSLKSNSVNKEIQSLIQESQVQNGVITDLNDEYGLLDNSLRFPVKACKAKFLPLKGDWVTVIYDSQRNGNIVCVQPKEQKCLHGIVTSHEGNSGTINNVIIFFLSSCHHDLPVYLGQEVLVSVIKCNRKEYKWRAVEITETSESDNMSKQTKPFLTNAEDVVITSPLNFGEVMLNQKASIVAKVKNKSPQPVTLGMCKFLKSNLDFFSITKMEVKASRIVNDVTKSSNIMIPPKFSLRVTIQCEAESPGITEECLLFEFEEFNIIRSVKINVLDPIEMLKPRAPYERVARVQNKPLRNDKLLVVPGEKPFRPKGRFSRDLAQNTVPQHLWTAIEEGKNIVEVEKCLKEATIPSNYVQKFKTLLHLEEIQMNIDIREFDLPQVCLYRRKEFLSLEVPGLAEGRPSVLIGDRVLLYHPSDDLEVVYEGYVHEVHRSEVLLKFNDSFQSRYDGESFNVSFMFNRTNHRRCHQCVEHVRKNNIDAIFPEPVTFKKPLVQSSQGIKKVKISYDEASPKLLSAEDVKWFNSQLNERQKEAVCRILEGQCRPSPYIVFGPPGTGKTACLVEAVLQVLATFKRSRIIICTPSNSAADLVIQRLLESEAVGEKQVVRLNSYQRNVDGIPECIKPFCKDKCSLDSAVKYPVIVTTLSTAGSIYALGLPTNYFSHVFIDEAGQATEPECLVGVGLVDPRGDGQVVVFGDPQQLGPVLRSTCAKTLGLQVSYLERIMQNKFYRRNELFDKHSGYNPLLVTMLIESYRCHPAILAFSSKEFYFSELVCNSEVGKKDPLDSLSLLPKKGFPIIFHGVQGSECREENSPSWFNSTEIMQVMMYLQKLYEEGLEAEDVGIITPYRKQVEKIRLMLTAYNLDHCKVGSVEEFQGQERKAIIISMVRSDDSLAYFDMAHNLGFVSNRKRTNVAITRAKQLLILVGNPYVLCTDHYWNGFIQYCVSNGGYIGCELLP